MERIIQILTDKKPVDIDRLLVVMFTEQAAYEMKKRMEMTLNELLAADPGNANITKQLSLIDRSFIMTIRVFA